MSLGRLALAALLLSTGTAAAQTVADSGTFLIQHSAGSGKSFTIGWLAHQLSTLHDAKDRRVFDSIVVVTDRRVLDRQRAVVERNAAAQRRAHAFRAGDRRVDGKAIGARRTAGFDVDRLQPGLLQRLEDRDQIARCGEGDETAAGRHSVAARGETDDGFRSAQSAARSAKGRRSTRSSAISASMSELRNSND